MDKGGSSSTKVDSLFIPSEARTQSMFDEAPAVETEAVDEDLLNM